MTVLAENDCSNQDSVELIQHWREGNESAGTELYGRFFNRLLPLVRQNLSAKLGARIDAEDVLQSFMRSFFRSEPKYTFEDDGQVWKFVITLCLNKVRKKMRHHLAIRRSVNSQVPFTDCVANALASPPTPQIAVSFQDTFAQLVELLSERQRTIVSLKLAGQTQSEIGQTLKVTDRTIRRDWNEIKKKAARMADDAYANAPDDEFSDSEVDEELSVGLAAV
ncbi:MAG: sigma-70 family RNA polymerase sigma factor [Planctomycetota bacterium]|nr:sigma-70 family RNA polymerase sigma factor [Planctomycetota bacterium]